MSPNYVISKVYPFQITKLRLFPVKPETLVNCFFTIDTPTWTLFSLSADILKIRLNKIIDNLLKFVLIFFVSFNPAKIINSKM